VAGTPVLECMNWILAESLLFWSQKALTCRKA